MLLQDRRAVEAFAGKSTPEVCEDIEFLKSLHQTWASDRRRILDIMNGQIARHLNLPTSESPPVPNFIYSGATRLAQKLNIVPKVQAFAHSESEPARKAAEKRERMVRGYEEGSQLDLIMPQLGRWVPPHGFAPMVVVDGFDYQGNPYPKLEAREPFDAYPSSWGVSQRPDRIAFIRRIDIKVAQRRWPHANIPSPRTNGGAVVLSRSGSQANSRGTIEFAEYIDAAGTWLVLPERQQLLSFTPNPINPIPPFVVARRFVYDRLIGHYDHVVGLLLASGRLNLLTLIAMEDAVFAELVVSGDLARGDTWHKGRGAVNFLEPGSGIQRVPSSVSPQMFQEGDRVERQLRVTSGYPVMDDAQSPNSFVTGRGLDNLGAGTDNEVQEYRTAFRRGLEEADEIMLRWDEAAFGNIRKPIFGTTEMYRASEIRGRYRTKRKFGLLSGFEEPDKVVIGGQLMQMGVLDTQTFMENLEGIDDVVEVQKRVAQDRSQTMMRDLILSLAQQGAMNPELAPMALLATIENMPESEEKQRYLRIFTQQGEQMSEEEQATVEQAAPPAVETGPQNSSTILARLFADGGSTLGAQTVGTVA